MVKPNWDIFKAKFQNPQNTFEWFCYLLFSREFNKPLGIARYKNQAALETEVIQSGEDIVGWQAKFYDTPLSNHKQEIVTTLKSAKKHYPTINKFLFYTNQEWGQSKGKEPQGKIEVEAEAKKLGISFEWRTASFFESTFVTVDNAIIAQNFFVNRKSIFDFLKELQTHSENILSEISTNIQYKGSTIEIDRGAELEKLKNSTEQVIILSGAGGVGKTALIKKYYELVKDSVPFYIFKSTEFELARINDLFHPYSLQDFLDAHKNELQKIVVIDSAEKLSDLKNTDPFKELFSSLLKNGWKLIFTTRDNYLEDLNHSFFEIYKVTPSNINLQNLETEGLVELSNKNNFSLPQDPKLLGLLKNPFYLGEFLELYKKDEEINYKDFKDRLWNKNIKKGKPAREQCFLKVASERVSMGQFFVNPSCDSSILEELVQNGILGYESPHGYFITHDVYEEWGLEKNIEVEFHKKVNSTGFFKSMGSALPMRRAFRKWTSEKLLLKNTSIKSFIEETLKEPTIEQFWKDEILVSVLLSDYSESFFEIFKDDLLKDGGNLLRKLSFLLRIACKEVDADFFSNLGVKNLNLFDLKFILTKPKGIGWESLVKFVYENLDVIGIQNLYFILPIIHDWNSKFKVGETTRHASLIALKFYEWSIKEDVFISDDDTKTELLQTIVYGAAEIKKELEEIFTEIVKNKWKFHRDPYYELSEFVLTKLEACALANILSKSLLQLADLFWTYTPKNDPFGGNYRMDINQYFDIEDDHLEYFPSSAYQTPIYWLLKSSLQETVDFILQFTNKSVEFFAKSKFAKYEAEEVGLKFPEPVKQYISSRLWNIYRGTTAPQVLESMHMALEKYLLEVAPNCDSKTLESWLLYLLKNSKSASITAVVSSVVMAFPEKTFNVAKLLFQTKDLFSFDTGRLVLESSHAAFIFFGLNAKNEIYEKEREAAGKDKHRKWSLENVFLNYQFFRSDNTTEEEANTRQKELWEILDSYYAELPKEADETDADKTWRLCLARMDRRKMKPELEHTDQGTLIHFNPDIEPKLKEYSEKSLEKNSEVSKHLSLKSWANYRAGNDEKYKQYEQYEKDPKLAIAECKEILEKLKEIPNGKPNFATGETGDSFYMFNNAIPVEVCSVLIRYYFDKLSKEEAEFCKDVVLESASSSIESGHQYSITDDTQAAFTALPTLFEKFLKDKANIKNILLRALFDDHAIDMAGNRFSVFSISAIHKLWEKNFVDAQSLLLGYLLLKPRLDATWDKMREEKRKKNLYNWNPSEVMKRFLKESKKCFQDVEKNKLTLDSVPNIEQLDLSVLATALQMIPVPISDANHKQIVNKIILAFAQKLLSHDQEDRVDYGHRHSFLEKLSYLVLRSSIEDVKEYLKPFLEKKESSPALSELFEQLISAEDYLAEHENFWAVWELFQGTVVEICKKGDGYWYVDEVVKAYLFAKNSWKENVREWHTFREQNKHFFEKTSQEIGHCPSALYAISKLLAGIGGLYLDEGVAWISNMISKNPKLATKKLPINTLYYLENSVKKFVYKNLDKIKRTQELKNMVLVILDFLIEKGSVVGYILRENIL